VARRTNELSEQQLAVISSKLTTKEIDFKTALAEFIGDCEIRNLRSHTIQYYKNELSSFHKILNAQDVDTMPQTIKPEHIKKNVILYMKDELGLKTVTINTRLRAIRAFFNFLYRESYIKTNPVRNVKLLKDRKTVVTTFTSEQINLLLRQPDFKTFTGIRDYTIMLLLLETGIRASEVVGLSLGDIRWEDSLLHIRNAKSYKERLVPIQKTMKEQLKRYLAIRGVLETDALFITIDEEPLTKRQLQNRVTKYGRMADIKGVRCSCHTFRHTMAKMSVKAGAGIFELQQILGHTSMEMVRVYVNLFSNDVKDKHKLFSPLNQIKEPI
jgi:integrase/recombinase XerD